MKVNLEHNCWICDAYTMNDYYTFCRSKRYLICPECWSTNTRHMCLGWYHNSEIKGREIAGKCSMPKCQIKFNTIFDPNLMAKNNSLAVVIDRVTNNKDSYYFKICNPCFISEIGL